MQIKAYHEMSQFFNQEEIFQVFIPMKKVIFCLLLITHAMQSLFLISVCELQVCTAKQCFSWKQKQFYVVIRVYRKP